MSSIVKRERHAKFPRVPPRCPFCNSEDWVNLYMRTSSMTDPALIFHDKYVCQDCGTLLILSEQVKRK